MFITVTGANFVKAGTALAKIITKPDWYVKVGVECIKSKKPHDVEDIIAEATKQLNAKKRKHIQKVKIIENTEDNNDAAEEDDDDESEKEKKKVKVYSKGFYSEWSMSNI